MVSPFNKVVEMSDMLLELVSTSSNSVSSFAIHSLVNLYTANVGRMTNSNSVISTNAYEPK